jgi:RHS repeat-associated protein
MGCPRLTYEEENEKIFFQGLWKKGDGDFFCDKYYPFGLQTANSWTRENTTGNNFLYNGGTELNTTTSLYDLEYRNYDPILGRMNQVDPMASKYASHSPYSFAFNDPVFWSDPSGADPWDRIWQVLATLWNSPHGGTWSRPQDSGTAGAGGGLSLFGSSREASSWASAYQSQQAAGGGGSIVSQTRTITSSGGWKENGQGRGVYFYSPATTSTETTYSFRGSNYIAGLAPGASNFSINTETDDKDKKGGSFNVVDGAISINGERSAYLTYNTSNSDGQAVIPLPNNKGLSYDFKSGGFSQRNSFRFDDKFNNTDGWRIPRFFVRAFAGDKFQEALGGNTQNFWNLFAQGQGSVHYVSSLSGDAVYGGQMYSTSVFRFTANYVLYTGQNNLPTKVGFVFFVTQYTPK